MRGSKKSRLFVIVLLAISLIAPSIPLAHTNPDIEKLYVDGFNSILEEWGETGSSPWLNDDITNEIYTSVDNEEHLEFTYADHVGAELINRVTFYIELKGPSSKNDQVECLIQIQDGGAWIDVLSQDPDADDYAWYSADISGYANTWDKINYAKLKIRYKRSGSPSTQTLYARRSYIEVDWDTPQVQSAPGTFGYTEGETGGAWTANYIIASWFNCPESGIPGKSISANITVTNIGDKFKFALYKHSNNLFVAGTEEFTATASGNQWITAEFTSEPTLENIDYWIIMWNKQDSYIFFDTDIAGKGGYQNVAYNGFPGSITLTLFNRKYNIYCTYGPPPPSDPIDLFGAGFNATSPYVELHWNHSLVDVQFFEVQNSSDGESWTYLGQSVYANYTDTQLVNGTERYYKVRACNQTEGTWYNSSWSDVNFEKVHFTEITKYACAPEFFNASSIEVIVGTLNDGNLASTYFVDGDWYNVSEVTGPPGLDIRVNFTGLEPGCGCFEFFQTYLGHSQHDIEVQIWNFTSTSWTTIGPVFYNETANWNCIGLGHYYSDFFSGGNLYARFYHETVGHPAHELQIDRIDLGLVQVTECPPAPPVDDYSIIFLAIGLILMLAIYFLYAREK